jgi:hypothetical protein
MKIYYIVRNAAVVALLIASTALVVSLTCLVRVATVTIGAVPGEIQATRTVLVGQVVGARRDLNVLAEGTQDDLNSQMTALRKETLAEVAEIRQTADRRIGDTLGRVDGALAHADTALGTVEAIRKDMKPVFDHAGSVAAQVDDAAPLFLDCDYNQDCAFNRFQGTSKAFERAAINFGQMSQDVRVALPGFVKNANSLVADSAATAANIKRLTTPKWYDRLIGYGLNGVLIYRNLNPVTNLTVTGATILSSRP